MKRGPGPRLVVYSQDGLGLGHMRRTSLLAAEFLASSPGATALTISDSPLGQFFAQMPGHDYLKLPSILKAGPGDWRPVSMAMPFAELLDLRRVIIRSTVLKLRPDVLLVDHMPHGAMGELLPTLHALESRPTRVVLGLRDILDAPATIRQRWAVEGALEAVEAYFDDVVVYGSRDVFDVARQYDWPHTVSGRLRYSGYVCSPPPPRSLAGKLRSRYRKKRVDGDLIVAMAGGGADADTLFDALLSAVPQLAGRRRCVVVIVTGPFLPSAERRALVRRASGLPVHVIKSVSDSMGYLGAADLVVAMAGYNTTAEILSLGQRALLVPRSGPSAEQQMRARLFAERGWVRWLAPEQLSASTLADAMDEALSTALAPPVAPDLNGRSRVAELLLRGLGAESNEPPPSTAASDSVLTEVLPATAAPEMAEQR